LQQPPSAAIRCCSLGKSLARLARVHALALSGPALAYARARRRAARKRMASSVLKGKHVLVNGAWGAGAALARHARAKGAHVSVIFDALEARFLGKSEADVGAAKQALLSSDDGGAGLSSSSGGTLQVLDCDSRNLDTLKACCIAAGA
jgi:hypothetical protein